MLQHQTLSHPLPTPPAEEWKQEILNSYSSVSDLLRGQLITPLEAEKLQALGEQFKVRITPYYASLMEASAECPIRKQAIPSLSEEDPILPDWASNLSQAIYGRPTPWHPDAIGDIQNLASPRITHRYQNRAILHLSSMCAVYCRFCFRKAHLNDSERTLYEGSLDPAFSYLKATPEIRELILTGGDPLSLTDSAFKKLLERISEIPHIRALRIHSRMAVTLPSRFTTSLLETLGRNRSFNISLVSHFNHPKELSPEALSALHGLKRAGVTLLNQSVLLNGINDKVETLVELFQTLFEAGVIPYYLHHPDWTPGTFHFRLSIERGRQIVSQLRGLLPGPALPEYVLDIPQGHGKASLMDSSLRQIRELGRNPGEEGALQGAIYEISAPATRRGDRSRHLYLDLHQ